MNVRGIRIGKGNFLQALLWVLALGGGLGVWRVTAQEVRSKAELVSADTPKV